MIQRSALAQSCETLVCTHIAQTVDLLCDRKLVSHEIQYATISVCISESSINFGVYFCAHLALCIHVYTYSFVIINDSIVVALCVVRNCARHEHV